MAEKKPGSQLTTFINIFTCEPGDQPALLDTLKEETAELVSKLDGFVSATLHASTDGRRVINYAQWTDLAAFNYIMGVMGRHHKSYPDIEHEILSVVESADGTSACRELRFSGTQSGQLKNPQTGEIILPTGRPVRWHAAEVVQVADGRITAWHAYFDRMEIDQQIRGVKP